jgi:1,4-dihydroxy-2-naphthoate octaprenyltransferase
MTEQNNQTNISDTYLNGDTLSLIGKLKSIDDENLKKLKRFRIIFFVLILFYCLIILLHPTANLVIIVLGMLVFLLVFTYS